MQVALSRISAPPGQSVIVSDMDIAEFEQFLAETKDDRHNRISYYHGVLEIMTPSLKHEKVSILFHDFMSAFFEEIDVDREAGGSTTLRGTNKEAAKEPDKCFYFALLGSVCIRSSASRTFL